MKTSNKVLIGLSSVVLLLVIMVCVLVVMLKNEYKYFNTVETGQLSSDLFVINDDFVNVFILHKDNQYLVIDSGNNKKNIELGLKQLGIDINNISVLLLTHTDYDHVAQVGLYRNAKVYISQDEEKMITGEIDKAPFIHNKLNAKYSLLPNNEIQKINNWNVQTILVPGHTAGSVCYYIEDKYLFTGDNIALINNKVIPFNDFFNMNTEQQKKNISNIANLNNVDLVLTAHYGISDKYVELFTEWKNSKKESN